MQILKHKLPANFNLFLFGDDHEGTLLRHNKGWNKLVNMMESEFEGIKPRHNYGVHHGDFIEAITVDDYRFDTQNEVLNQISQLNTRVAVFEAQIKK